MKLRRVCPCCRGTLEPLWSVRSYRYYRCQQCASLTVDPEVIREIDAGRPLVRQGSLDAAGEAAAARERAYGTSLARVAEAVLYARTPIRRFLDVGTGHGFLLDALAMHLPAHRDTFYGVEPAPPEQRSAHPNYAAGTVSALPETFQAGSCIEVIQHLTPMQLRALLAEIATRSERGALYIVNSGQPRYVLDEDPAYLDPDARGHIVSYSIAAMASLAEPLGFRVIPLPGKSWALLLEYLIEDGTAPPDRIWTAPPENVALLRDPDRGSVLHVLGTDTARAYQASASG
ncbi:MAG TPA: class I SAM-dependent methyltransferase [Candidatus Elarobacter sp.]|nr:class I SAM-dependent methyltransferase [Candidatus Elarobacter sp.]